MEKTIYLHIGAHKTGTSAIQLFLSQNRSVLQQNDILYAGRNTACYDLSDELITKKFPEIISNVNSASKKYLDEIQKTSCDKIILSSEGFIKLDKAGVEALRKIFPERYKIKIIIYLRKQDESLESYYNQLVREPKNRCQQKFYDCMPKILEHGYFDYYSILLKWAEVFGKENIMVRCYEKEQLPEGIFEDFNKAAGIDPDKKYKLPDEHVNISMNWDLIEIIRLCNVGFKDNLRLHRFLLNSLKKINRADKKANQRLLSPHQRREILNRFSESNANVAREFLGRTDGRLFYAPLPDPFEPWTPYTGLTVEKFVPVLTQMIVNQDREHRNQRNEMENFNLKQKIVRGIRKIGARFGLVPAAKW